MDEPNRVTEIVEKLTFPCINKSCDNQGTIIGTDSDGDPCPEQCEYCYRERFPFQDELTKALTEYGAEREARGRKMAVEYIKENSTGVIVGRTEDDVPILGHWILKPETLEAALTNHTV